MIKALIFDVDGCVIKTGVRFSTRFSHDFGIPMESMLQFFENEFRSCLVGKADLKTVIVPYLKQWGVAMSADQTLSYWFSGDTTKRLILDDVDRLRLQNIPSFLATDNERYRTNYLFHTIGLSTYFVDIFSSSSIGYKKNDPNFWSRVLRELAPVKASEILFFDDDQLNVDAALRCGLNARLYTDITHYQHDLANFFNQK